MRSLLYTILVTALFMISWNEIPQQSDPLSKPTVWQKLTTSPSDSSLWALYVGKPWVCMTIVEKEKIDKWQSELRIEVRANQKSTEINPENADKFWETEKEGPGPAELAAAEERREVVTYLKQLEEVMVEEPSFLSELKTNVGQNFIIIEDTYREEFMALGKEYKDYQSSHPNGKFSKQQWVDQKGRELQELKRKEFEKIKSQMLAGE